MEEKKKVVRQKGTENIRAIRWDEKSWMEIGELAAANGMTRSGFIKQATAYAAALVASGWAPAQFDAAKGRVTQDVGMAKASTHLGGR